MKRFLILFVVFAANCSVALGATLIVTVPDILEIKGTLRIGVWNVKNKQEFPLNDKKASIAQVKKVTKKNINFKFKLPKGKYAIAILQDLNMNGEIDEVPIIGLPLEPYGFSNDARGSFGPPDFEDAAFYLSKEKKIKIHLEQ